MTKDQLKECNRIFWIVKGHLIPESWSDTDILQMYDQYTKKIWGNHEATFHEVGFEDAWNARTK